MSVVINTNTSAIAAKNNLNKSNAMLQNSLARLSSGSKIVNPSDDAGGLAVSMKMSAAIKRTEATSNNIANAQSFLQTQDGALATAGKILDRMSELKTLSEDVTKNTTDKANYNTEFEALKAQLGAVAAESFNGVSLMNSSSMTVKTSEDGSQTVAIAATDFSDDTDGIHTDLIATSSGTTSLGASGITLDKIKTSIENVATLRATNGAQSSRLSFASDMLATNKQNLEAANSRIIDVDVATESTQLARANILVQAGSSMLSQANASSQTALRLIG
ncbi:flagellin [Pelagicoccus sp. NFK12]|uniref:Flagellin n=1 Tax=Pelagicoccus enzymogenes TaxID=2773457 RepID=A0A927FAU4_9BACT|nr:flagellin [Pelagicoccus enzymogenes]MBD5781682.1 flagellin [Pelagicoccus enzymogenes]MDQ8200038.1 flagellin [Pelagicoccus enzymogenes]